MNWLNLLWCWHMCFKINLHNVIVIVTPFIMINVSWHVISDVAKQHSIFNIQKEETLSLYATMVICNNVHKVRNTGKKKTCILSTSFVPFHKYLIIRVENINHKVHLPSFLPSFLWWLGCLSKEDPVWDHLQHLIFLLDFLNSNFMDQKHLTLIDGLDMWRDGIKMWRPG